MRDNMTCSRDEQKDWSVLPNMDRTTFAVFERGPVLYCRTAIGGLWCGSKRTSVYYG